MKNRIHKRIPVSAVVNYIVEGRSYQDYVRDISVNGIFIETQENFNIGQRIVMTFSHSSIKKPIKAIGTIIRNSPNGFAIEYGEINNKRIPKNKKWDAERRIQNRAKVEEEIFVVINEPYPMLGVVLDISEDGLSFIYSEATSLPKVLPSLNIIIPENSSEIENLPVKAKWAKKLSRNHRKIGIQFQQLTTNQRLKLQSIIQH